MQAACATIEERWPNIEPTSETVLAERTLLCPQAHRYNVGLSYAMLAEIGPSLHQLAALFGEVAALICALDPIAEKWC